MKKNSFSAYILNIFALYKKMSISPAKVLIYPFCVLNIANFTHSVKKKQEKTCIYSKLAISLLSLIHTNF